jgi:transposase-like protein
VFDFHGGVFLNPSVNEFDEACQNEKPDSSAWPRSKLPIAFRRPDMTRRRTKNGREVSFPTADGRRPNCLVHMVRNSLKFVNWKQRKEVAADLKAIHTSTTVEAGEQRLTEFEEKWNQTLAPIGLSWRRNWERIIPFFSYPPEIRKVVYTTNAIESINMSLRKITTNRGSFPSDDSLAKLFYPAR